MDPIRHQRVSDLFAEVMGLDPAARRSILLSRCGDDPSLIAEIEELLAHHDGQADRVGAGIVTGAMNVGDLFDPAAADAADRPGMGSALASTARVSSSVRRAWSCSRRASASLCPNR